VGTNLAGNRGAAKRIVSVIWQFRSSPDFRAFGRVTD